MKTVEGQRKKRIRERIWWNLGCWRDVKTVEGESKKKTDRGFGGTWFAGDR